MLDFASHNKNINDTDHDGINNGAEFGYWQSRLYGEYESCFFTILRCPGNGKYLKPQKACHGHGGRMG